MPFKNILVPVDFSEFSDRAMDYTLFLATQYRARLTLLHAVVLHLEEVEEEIRLQEYEDIVKAREVRIHQQLEAHQQQAEQQGVAIESRVIRGISAADAILEYLADNPFDLVALGTHGRTGIKKFLYGNVAEKIVRLSPAPVLTIHKSFRRFDIQRILIPVDFSDYSKKAVKFALSITKQFSADPVFLHVSELELHPVYYPTNFESLFIRNPELKERSETNLKEFIGSPLKNAAYVVKEGRAYKEIVRYAEENKIDLIVMATRGLTGLEHLLIGSTTERVVRLSPVPVLTVGRER